MQMSPVWAKEHITISDPEACAVLVSVYLLT